MRRYTRWLFVWAVVLGLAAFGATRLYAAEHPGKEHAGATQKESVGTTTKEHAGTAATKEHAGATATKEHAGATQQQAKIVEPTNEQIRQAMTDYALRVTQEHGGFFPIADERAGKGRKLIFQRVHERVGKLSTRDGYFSCSDFVDLETNEKLDVDFWLVNKKGKLEVTGAEIHKVNGAARFTYNEKDEKISL